MNVLVKEQMKLFEPNLDEKEYAVRFANYLKKYYQQRDRFENSMLNRLNLKQRQGFHSSLLGLYKLVNRLSGLTYEIISDNRSSQISKPIIFAVTHVGIFDIQILTEAIKTHCYVLTSGFESIQGTFKSLALALNGVFYFNSKIKSDRQAVTNRMISHLNNGGNIMYFPEGAWNLSPNRLVMPCYWGIIDVARKGNAVIVPIACEQYGKKFKINIGTAFDVSRYDVTDIGKSMAISDLRDALATLKYEIFEAESIIKRNTIDKEYWKKYLLQRFREWSPISIKTIAKYKKSKVNKVTVDDFLMFNINYTVDLLYNNKNENYFDNITNGI